MAQVSSKVVINQRVIDQLCDAAELALELTGEWLHTEVIQAQVMPRDTGVLQGERTELKAGRKSITKYEDGTEVVNAISKASGGTVTISTAAPQARRLYFHPEYNFQKGENPNAGGGWFEAWQKGGPKEQEVHDAFAALYRRLSGV